MFFFFNVPATTEIESDCHTLSLHDALPILLPAGPLREPVAGGLARADAVIVIGPATAPLPDFGRLPVFAADLHPDAEDAARLRGRRVLAFAGIGRPEKFFASLERLGAEIVQRQVFADHAPYAPDTVMRLAEAAQQQDALPVRSEERRVGKECVSKCRSRWSTEN